LDRLGGILMLRRRKRRKKYMIACVILLLASFVYGYVSNETKIFTKPNKEAIDPLKISQEQPTKDAEKNNTEENNTNNTRFLLKTYYENTRDTITKEIKIPTDIVGKNLEEVRNYLENAYGEWDIRELDKELIELYRIREGISPNHYIVKQSNGYIAIFHVDEDGTPILLEQTNIPVSALTELDREKLLRGIIVKGMDSVTQILEDYSS
ncbi:MAG: BofC C-terminal domain-containing protein, partial [Thermotaleaceae bacterium]